MPTASTTFMPLLFAGDQVTLNYPGYPGVYVVKRVKKTKAIIVPVNDLTGRGLDVDMVMLSAATDASGARLPRVALPAPAPRTAPASGLRLGSIIRLNRAWEHYTTQDLFVVISKNRTTVSAALLGGEGADNYVRLGHNSFTIVDRASVTLAN